MELQAESISNSSKSHLLTNYSTGQLIPSCRGQLIQNKRQAIRRKLNRLADQIYSLKYDTQYQMIELKRLNKMGDQFFQTVQNMKEKAKKEIQAAKIVQEEPLNLDLNKIAGTKSESTDRSTERSILTERNLEEKKDETQLISKFDQNLEKKENIRFIKLEDLQRSTKCLDTLQQKQQSKRLFFQSKNGPTENNEHFWNFCLFLLGIYIAILIL